MVNISSISSSITNFYPIKAISIRDIFIDRSWRPATNNIDHKLDTALSPSILCCHRPCNLCLPIFSQLFDDNLVLCNVVIDGGALAVKKRYDRTLYFRRRKDNESLLQSLLRNAKHFNFRKILSNLISPRICRKKVSQILVIVFLLCRGK